MEFAASKEESIVVVLRVVKVSGIGVVVPVDDNIVVEVDVAVGTGNAVEVVLDVLDVGSIALVEDATAEEEEEEASKD